tara:strand:+ start:229 stop:627 length:399 start_codon:yes stop_codon:yes gene_type:complete
MNNQKRRPFRSRQGKNNYRGRSNGSRSNNNSPFQSVNGNSNFGRNGSMTNPFNVEKTIQKFQQLAKDAQSYGDPVLVENYLQHADHYSRRLSELNSKTKTNTIHQTDKQPSTNTQIEKKIDDNLNKSDKKDQ